jgi:hypothetical protein
MWARLGLVALFLAVAALGSDGASAATLRPAKNRPDIIEVGDPVTVGRPELSREMELNSSLREYVELYGWPDYVEVQEVTVQEPWAAYEVRLFYLRRDEYLVFGRVHVAPSIEDYGARKYTGAIDSDTLDRLLTASPPPPAVEPHTTGANTQFEAPPEVMAEVEPQAEPVHPVDAAPAAAAEVAPVIPANPPIAADAPAEPSATAHERVPGSPDLSHIVARMEAAADRATLAAEEAERASLAANASADRATTVLDRVSSEYRD